MGRGLCLLAVLATVAADPSAPRIGLLFRFEHEPDPNFLQQVRNDFEMIFRSSGLSFHWKLNAPGAPEVCDELVRVQMRGRCEVQLFENQSEPQPEPMLGWTMLDHGAVVPYLVVDCDRIAGFLKSLPLIRRGGSPQWLPALYARLAARVLAHELLHVLLRTTEHRDSELAGEKLKPSDLFFDARLHPAEAAALGRIYAGAACRPQSKDD